jgi:hypothetical protein
MWLYASIAPRYGAGRMSAAIAGASWWLIATITTWQWSDIGFMPLDDLAGLIVASLPLLVAIVIVGAWSYEKGVRRHRRT